MAGADNIYSEGPHRHILLQHPSANLNLLTRMTQSAGGWLKCQHSMADAGRQSVGFLVGGGCQESCDGMQRSFGTRKLQPARAALDCLHLTPVGAVMHIVV